MRAPPPGPALRLPRQERSRRTLERVLDATEALLRDRTFEAIPVSQILVAAGTSAGAFYARFRDKDALLPALYERYERWVEDRARRSGARSPRGDRPLKEVVTWLARESVDLFRHRPSLLRAMALHVRRHPEKIDDETRARRARTMRYLRDALLSRRDEIGHPDPERAADLAVFFAFTTCREAILFRDAPHAAATRLDDAELEREVARMILAYLGARGASKSPPPNA